MKRKSLIILLCFVLFCQSVFSIDYYADITATVTKDGFITIEGETNHPDLIVSDSPNYTSKKGAYWLLNLSFDGEFSDYIYRINLPEGASVNYLKLPGLARIEDNDKGISVIGTGSDQNLKIVIQYQFKRDIAKNDSVSLLIFGIVWLTALALIAIIISIRRKKKKMLIYDSNKLTDRQKLILDIIIKSKKPITQAQVEKETNLPKSSLSRNIDKLVMFEMIRKEQKGMSNILFINKKEK